MAGPLGTFAELKIKDEKITDAKPLPLDTVAPVVSGSSYGQKAAALTADNQLHIAENSAFTTLSAPAGLHPVAVHLFSQQGIVLIDGNGKIAASQDNGKTWLYHTGPMRKADSGLKEIQFSGQNGKNGFYLYSRNENGVRPRIVYSPYERIAFEPIELPSGLNAIFRFWAKESGLFIDTGPRVFSMQQFYYRSPGTNTWVKGRMPGTSCNFGFTDDAGTILLAECSGWKRFSEDMGKTWQDVPDQ